MQWVHAPLSHGDAAAGNVLPPALAEGDLGRHYVNSLVERTETLAEVIEHLASRDNLPAVFHCTAGKDRTGVAAALVLLALGVPRDIVLQDYLLTNDLAHPLPPQHQTTVPLEALAVLWRVQQGFLDSALRVVDADHGGIERYLTQRLRLSRGALDALAARYLQTD